jgi:hypothetical protein
MLPLPHTPQPHCRHFERPVLYRAVLMLRRNGWMVYRCGRGRHKVVRRGYRARVLDHNRLIRFAREAAE